MNTKRLILRHIIIKLSKLKVKLLIQTRNGLSNSKKIP